MTTNIKVEFLSEALENDISSKYESDKCGEVFVTKKGIFSCFCIVCKQYFEEIDFFTEHILSLHLNLKSSENNLIKATESFQQEKKESLLTLQLINIENKTNEARYLNSEISSEKNFDSAIESNILDPLELQEDVTTENNEKTSTKMEIEIDENVESQNSEEEAISDFNENEMDEKFPFKCEICNRSYKLKNAFIAHQKRHENVMPSCSHCGKNFCDKQSFKRHNQILCAQRKELGVKSISKDLPNIKCKYCPKVFKRNFFLKCHEDRHLNSPFKCNHCSKIFMVKHLLDDHLRTHTGERPYKCEYCTSAFAHITNLNRHTLIHIGERTYVCTFGCGKAFYKERERAGHERIHTGEKPFVCELCGRYFAFHCKLSLHKKRFHMDKKNRPHKCDQCDKAFITPKQLHEHIVVHTGEKPFACDQCTGRFSKASGLREHKKLHSGIKKHICTICSKAFAQAAGLYGHMKSHGIIKENTEIS